MVVVAATVGVAVALNDPSVLQLLQARRQQRRGHTWHTLAQVVEARAARQQLAQHERSPARTNQLCCHRYRAKLPVTAVLFHWKPPSLQFGGYGQLMPMSDA